MQQLDIPIVHHVYELYRGLHELQKTVPKAEKYTLWQRCENDALDILENLLSVPYLANPERVARLTSASVRLDRLRVLLRLSFDIRIINQKKYISLQATLDEIGRMLGGWLKSLKPK